MNTTDTHDDIDLLISRVLDGAADAADLQRLAAHGAQDASTWSRFGAWREDHERIRTLLASDHARASSVGLPLMKNASTSAPARWPGRRAVGFIGWAAAIALAAVIAFDTPTIERDSIVRVEDVQPHVIGVTGEDELDPLIMHTERLPDGRWRVTWMRRTIEELTLDGWDEAWIRQELRRKP